MNDWEEKLTDMLNKKAEQEGDSKKLKQTREELDLFFRETVLPAFKQLRQVINKHDSSLVADIELQPYSVTLRIIREGEEEFFYTVEECRYHKQRAVFPYIPRPGEAKSSLARVVLPSGNHFEKNFDEFSRDLIIDDFLKQYGLNI